MQKRDERALQVARLVQQREQPDLVILFGSRARGDYDELKSDIDIMLVQETEPDAEHKRSAVQEANFIATETYGRLVPVELVWRTRDQFRFNRRYVNSVETSAARDGVVMPLNPEDYGAGDYEDEEKEYEYDWSNYRERIRHAETHLDEFIFMAESNRSDLVIGQQAQNALEHGMKALIAAVGGQYTNTHNIGELLGNVRHFDPEMRDFRLAIPPDVYTEYEGRAEYRERKQTELTEYEGYLEKTMADVARIIDRAKELHGQATNL